MAVAQHDVHRGVRVATSVAGAPVFTPDARYGRVQRAEKKIPSSIAAPLRARVKANPPRVQRAAAAHMLKMLPWSTGATFCRRPLRSNCDKPRFHRFDVCAFYACSAPSSAILQSPRSPCLPPPRCDARFREFVVPPRLHAMREARRAENPRAAPPPVFRARMVCRDDK